MNSSIISIINILLLFCSLPRIGNVSSQIPTATLPADLFFTTGEAIDNTNWIMSDRNVLARVDAETLEVAPFYYDEQAKLIKAISWSPQGDLLAIYLRFPSSDSPIGARNQLCLVNRSGVLKTCFEATPPVYGEVENYNVSWSEDGQKAYFVAGQENASQEHDVLVEADVITGRTIRMVYDYPHEVNLSLSWTPTITHVITNAGAFEEDLPRLLIDLETGQSIDLKAVVPEPAVFSSACLHFSTKGTYLTIKAETFIENTVSRKELILLDKNGQIHAVIDESSGFGPMDYLGCPVWQEDEEAFYLVGIPLPDHESYIFKYSLSSTLYSQAA
jgi:hypothetical protein